MKYLKQLPYRPNPYEISEKEAEWLLRHFQVGANEVVINNNQVVKWKYVDEIEVAKAARMNKANGFLLKWFVYQGEERYHVGIYYGGMEAVLKNVSLKTAIYIVKMVAYYTPQRVIYTGPDDLVPLEIVSD